MKGDTEKVQSVSPIPDKLFHGLTTTQRTFHLDDNRPLGQSVTKNHELTLVCMGSRALHLAQDSS